jgi:hypothetical protein
MSQVEWPQQVLPQVAEHPVARRRGEYRAENNSRLSIRGIFCEVRGVINLAKIKQKPRDDDGVEATRASMTGERKA